MPARRLRTRQWPIFMGVVALIGVSLLPATATGASPAGCSPSPVAGGEWRGYGENLGDDRNQPAEDVIGPAQASRLRPVWRFSGNGVSQEGVFESTP
ncbi:MAG TPA: hypothetical protein VF972_07320, partial [Actinomycetota bacterium]